MDPVWIAVAFVLGFVVRQVGLPPLVGFLAAGFVLRGFGVESDAALEKFADFGIILLLFSIGLKLKIKSLLRAEVWATASLHMLITVIVFGAGIYVVSLSGIPPFGQLDLSRSLLVAFALSFSSTVFAVKLLEEKGEMASAAGRLAIGILIMQDLFAVVFITLSSGKVPSPWAFALLALPLLRPVLGALMSRSGHGELLVLLGVLFPFAGGELFKLVGLKPDLGALLLGVLLAGHPKSDELSKALLSFKDLFLVGFFLTIGLSEAPTLKGLGIAAILVLLVPFKVGFFFLLFTRFKLMARPSTLSSLSLANYSEFGLIVGALGVSNGWITTEWLVIFALAMSITFVLASPLNSAAHAIYARYDEYLRKFETEERLPEDQPIDPGDAEILVVGMGRTGSSAYDRLKQHYGDVVLGADRDPAIVKRHQEEGRTVILGDATDLDFWKRLQPRAKARMVLLAMGDHGATMYAARTLKSSQHVCTVAATAVYDDEIEELKKVGVDTAYNLYAEAGVGFAEDVAEGRSPRSAKSPDRGSRPSE